MIANEYSATKAQNPPSSKGKIAKILNCAFFQIPHAAFSKTIAIQAAPNIVRNKKK